jgi:hypothetical protein
VACVLSNHCVTAGFSSGLFMATDHQFKVAIAVHAVDILNARELLQAGAALCRPELNKPHIAIRIRMQRLQRSAETISSDIGCAFSFSMKATLAASLSLHLVEQPNAPVCLTATSLSASSALIASSA